MDFTVYLIELTAQKYKTSNNTYLSHSAIKLEGKKRRKDFHYGKQAATVHICTY